MKASPTTLAALTGLSLIALSTIYAAVFAQNLNVVPPAFGAPAPQAAAPSPACRDEQGLTYICNLVIPEDILNLGSTGLLLASGHRAPGHMYLIDPATRTQSELIHGATFRQQHDTRAYPGCPGPLNLQAFDVHGLSLAETSPRRFSVYTTSHGAREAIEIYDLDLRGSTPILTWTGCVLLEQGRYHNSVARLADGGFVATNMRDANFTRTEGVPPGITGHLVEWHPGGQVQRLAGTEMSLPNGIDVSKDERYVFVAANGTHEVVRFDRRATPMAKRAVSLPMSPDNVHWDANGKLLSAGPNVAPGSGWSVIELNPETLAFSRLGGADQKAAMQRVSAAMRVGDDIWVASNMDRIGRFSLKRP
jgi:hypothetical protein